MENTCLNLISKSRAVLHYNHLEEFQALATQSQIIAYTYLDSQNVFEAYAVKNNQIFVYTGEIPRIEVLLKAWLSKLLLVPQEKIFQGTIKP